MTTLMILSIGKDKTTDGIQKMKEREQTMGTENLRDGTYAYCPGECEAQIDKALYDKLTQNNDGKPAICGDPHGVGCSRKGQPLIVR